MRQNSHLKWLAVPILVGVAGVAIGTQAEPGASTDTAPLSCEITAKSSNGALMIEGVAKSETPTEGVYQLSVKSLGGSNRTSINQGGAFATDHKGDAQVGKVTLGGSGSSYKVELAVTAGGNTAECTEKLDAHV